MNFNIVIAKRIGNKSDSTGRMSRLGNRISVIAVTLSVAIIIISIAVSNGFRKEIRYKVRGFASDIVISAPGADVMSGEYPINYNLSGIKEVRELPYVESVSPVSYRSGLIREKGEISGLFLKGVDENYNMDFYAKHLVAGELPKYSCDSVSKEVVISKRLADALGYSVGDKIYSFFAGDVLKMKNLEIVGIFNAQLEQLDKVLAIADIKLVNELNGWKKEVSGFEIFTDNSNLNNEDYRYNKIMDIIYSSTTDQDSSVMVSTLKDRFYILFDWLHLLDLNVYIILALMIAVAGFNMVSGLLIMLFERIAQIGLLKAMGMTNKNVSKIFLIKAAIVVLKGMLYGNVLAILICLVQKNFNLIELNPEFYFVSYIPIDFNLINIVAVNIISFLLIMLIMLVPTHFISKVSPANTMRVK
jgi:ABC-type transport system, involved in lipoprotein release, permease component